MDERLAVPQLVARPSTNAKMNRYFFICLGVLLFLILLEIILLPNLLLFLLVLVREIRPEPGAEVNMPSPEPSHQ